MGFGQGAQELFPELTRCGHMSRKGQKIENLENEDVSNIEDGRRLTHNEVERRRRDNQRERLEELRGVIPNINDTRPSMIGTLIRAKEYIELLQNQVRNLEKMLALSQTTPSGNYGGYSVPTGNMNSQPYIPMHVPGTYSAPSGALPPKIHSDPDPGGLPLLAPKPAAPNSYTAALNNFMLGKRRSNDFTADPLPGEAENSKVFRQGRHGSFANLFSIMEEAASVQENHHSSELLRPTPSPAYGSYADKPRTGRRDSALLLPTADPKLFLYGRRDSMQNLFAAPLPYIMEQQDSPNDVIKCQGCKGDIDNLIMIDCDICHSWYHIRCIGLDPERIPIKWACSSCAEH